MNRRQVATAQNIQNLTTTTDAVPTAPIAQDPRFRRLQALHRASWTKTNWAAVDAILGTGEDLSGAGIKRPCLKHASPELRGSGTDFVKWAGALR
jgi:hypothetical protein